MGWERGEGILRLGVGKGKGDPDFEGVREEKGDLKFGSGVGWGRGEVT